MLDAHHDGMIWACWIAGTMTALFAKQIDTVVAVNGVFVAIGVWRFGAAYRDRVDRDLKPLSRTTGANIDDSEEVQAAIEGLYRDAEKMAARMIITGTVIGAVAPVLWRLAGFS